MALVDHSVLNQTLVLTAKKSFWASKECLVFPNRLYTKKIFFGPGRWGSQSRNPVNNITVILAGLAYAQQKKPRVIIIGSASRAASWFARFKKAGWLPNIHLLVTTHSYLNDLLAEAYSRIIIYSRGEIQSHPITLHAKYRFIHLPADGNFDNIISKSGDYIFAGGGAGRDFATLIHAIKPLPIRLKIITFSKKSLNYSGNIPNNCEILLNQPLDLFLDTMANSRFVVNPLIEGQFPHGQTTLVQALRLGKAVISTKNASVEDYIIDGRTGSLISAGDIHAYRNAIQNLYDDDSSRLCYEKSTKDIQPYLTYKNFANCLIDLCRELI